MHNSILGPPQQAKNLKHDADSQYGASKKAQQIKENYIFDVVLCFIFSLNRKGEQCARYS